MPAQKWFGEQDAVLRELADQGLTAREIGERMGVTHNAVIGRCNRAGIKLAWLNQHRIGERKSLKTFTVEERRARKREQQRRWRANHPEKHRAARSKYNLFRRERNQIRRQAMLSLNLTDYPNAVHILKREFWNCPWPLWCEETPFSEKMYCGTHIEPGGNWCSAHCAMAHNSKVVGQFKRVPGMSPNRWTIQSGRAAA